MDNPLLSHWLAVAEAGTDPVINALQQRQDTLWFNPQRVPFAQVRDQLLLQLADIEDAAHRLQRFAGYFTHAFPETARHYSLVPKADMQAFYQQGKASLLCGHGGLYA